MVKKAVKKGVDQLSEEIASDINQIEKGVTNTKLDFERFEEQTKKAMFSLESKFDRAYDKIGVTNLKN